MGFDDRMSFLGGGRACMYVSYPFSFCMLCSFLGNSGYRFATIEISMSVPSCFDVDANILSIRRNYRHNALGQLQVLSLGGRNRMEACEYPDALGGGARGEGAVHAADR